MYKLFYKLNNRPFPPKTDLNHFYTTRTHKRAIMHLRAGFEQADGILVLSGENGLGKTTLVKNMLEEIDKDKNLIAFIGNPPQADQDFLPTILSAFQLPVTDTQPKALFNALHSFILEKVRLHKKVLLLIDNAETLSNYCLEVIRLLSSLHWNERGLLQIVLVGSSKLEDTIASQEHQALEQQITMVYSMQPMQLSETKEYIEHHLKLAGWNGDPVIDDDAFDAIYELSKGVPSEVNRYCDRLLMLGMLQKTHHISAKDVASLTVETMEKLESFEALQMEQDKLNKCAESGIDHSLPFQSVPGSENQAQQSIEELNMDNYALNTQTKSNNRFFNKQTAFTIMAAYLVSTLSIFAYNKFSVNSPLTANAGHSEVTKSHSVAEASSTSSVKTFDTAKYVLAELPAETSGGAHFGNDSSEKQLLNIQQLLEKSQRSNSVVANANRADF